MTRPVRVKGFHIYADRHGKQRCYHRKSRTAVDLAKAPIGSAEFFAECARIAALTKAAGPPRPGTLGLLIAEYRASVSLPTSPSGRGRTISGSDTPLARFDRPLVVRIRDKAQQQHRRRFANYVKSVFSVIFGFGAERG